MKKVVLILLAALLVQISGCRKPITFQIVYEPIFEVPSLLGINLPFNLPTPSITTHSEQIFESNDTRKHLIENIDLTTLKLTITSPSNKSFDFLQSITIEIQGDGEDAEPLAEALNIPKNIGNELVLIPSGLPLDKHIKPDHFTLLINVVTDETLFQNVEIQSLIDLQVQAKSIF